MALFSRKNDKLDEEIDEAEVEKTSKRSSKKKKSEKSERRSFTGNPFLKAVKPREKYIFHSDYFEIDDCVACILMFRHNSAAVDNFGPFWGVMRIPRDMPEGVITMNFEQISKMTDGWITEHQTKAEGVSEINNQEQTKSGTNTTRTKSTKSQIDLQTIALELNQGATYLNVHDRLLVKAKDLPTLELALARLDRLYLDRFGSLSVAPYLGDQRKELSDLFGRNATKRGKGEYFTSTEFAGAYSLVTHGLEDKAGEYVGYMFGDVNTSAVLFDVDDYRHHVVVASEQINTARGRAHVSDMWGSKIGQACLLNGHKVVHILLGPCDLDKLGPRFERFTHKVDMNHGDVNMFEMFGERERQMSIFPAQMQKLILMAEQAYETTDSDRSIIRSSLEDVATQFYIEQRMWVNDAARNEKDIRVVGIPHDQVPLLHTFVSYLKMEYEALVRAEAKDPEKVHAMSILATTFDNLLKNNGSLFDKVTSSVIDNARGGRRVVYDFSQLEERGSNIAMAQLVNIIDFAVAQAGLGDVVIIHSAERIVNDNYVRNYLNTQFDRLYARGGRVAFLYNSIEKMLDDADFNKFDKADYTLLGNMSDNTVELYQRKLGAEIPKDLETLITDKSNAIMYIRRGFDNVVFRMALKLDIEETISKRTMKQG